MYFSINGERLESSKSFVKNKHPAGFLRLRAEYATTASTQQNNFYQNSPYIKYLSSLNHSISLCLMYMSIYQLSRAITSGSNPYNFWRNSFSFSSIISDLNHRNSFFSYMSIINKDLNSSLNNWTVLSSESYWSLILASSKKSA